MQLFFKKNYQHVRNAVLAVYAKPGPVCGQKRENERAITGRKITLTCPFQIVAVSRPCIRFITFRYRFEALTKWRLTFVVSRSKLL